TKAYPNYYYNYFLGRLNRRFLVSRQTCSENQIIVCLTVNTDRYLSTGTVKIKHVCESL
ncbi:hypothetical protein CAPTEDRAFT_145489, partial [Capitella teleta]